MRSWLSVVFALLAAPLAAQIPPTPAQPAPERVYFPMTLERFAAGKPIPLVAVSLGDAMGRPQPPPKLSGKTFKEALAIIGDAYSDRLEPNASPTQIARWKESHETLVPYEFPNVWTIARDHQWEFAKTPNIPEVLTATSPTVLLPRLVDSLTDKQLRLATTTGLTFKDFTPRQQPVFRAVFHRPLRLVNYQPEHADGSPSKDTEDFDGVLPIEQCRMRLNLAFTSVFLEAPVKTNEPFMWWLDQYGAMVHFPEAATSPDGYTFPVLNSVPAKLKASDLAFDAPSLNAPIGVSGILRLDKAVEAAAKATGLVLRVDPRFASDNVVFIGDKALRTGDVLRAFAFDVQGAWRRVGEAYILTFDRAPLGATQMSWEDKLNALDRDRDALLETQLGHHAEDRGERFMQLLQGDPEWCPGPTSEQMATLIGSETDPISDMRVLTFGDLAPGQQEAVKELMRGNSVFESRPDVDSPEIVARLPQATLNTVGISMTLEVPEVGRYRVRDYRPAYRPGFLSFVRDIEASKAADQEEKREQPITISAKNRALAVPPLLRAEWPRLLTQMRRKGLDTLYLPVLWDGYTLYPSKQFPMLSIARQRDLLAEVLALAAKEKIKVVALLHTLAWRHPGGSELHWLLKHPTLVDRDVAGQGRRDWTMAHLDYLNEHKDRLVGDLLRDDPFLFSDMVRPTEPSVKKRLSGVLDELRGYKGLYGVAFAEWSRVSYAHYINPDQGYDEAGPPILGYAVSQRAAFIKEQSMDPGDFEKQGGYRIQVPTFSGVRDQQALDNAWAKVRLNEDTALLKALKASAEASWPGRVHIFSALEPSTVEEQRAIPPGDVNVRGGMMAFLYAGVWMSFAPSPDMCDDSPGPKDGKTPDRMTELATQLEHGAAIQVQTKRGPLPGVVLDFRAAASLLWDGLARLANAPSTGKGQ